MNQRFKIAAKSAVLRALNVLGGSRAKDYSTAFICGVGYVTQFSGVYIGLGSGAWGLAAALVSVAITGVPSGMVCLINSDIELRESFMAGAAGALAAGFVAGYAVTYAAAGKPQPAEASFTLPAPESHQTNNGLVLLPDDNGLTFGRGSVSAKISRQAPLLDCCR